MNAKKLLSLFVLSVLFYPVMAQYTDAEVDAYVEKYKGYAVKAMEKYKIPVSIKLAQAIYSSACGTNRLAVEGFNHFGITCRGGWEGETFYYDNINTGPDHCFRKYTSVEASYQNHSVFLASRERYAALFELDITDYKGWAEGLFKAGYAGNPNYPQKLINIIEKYHLNRFDHPEENVKKEEVVEEKSVVKPVNDVVKESEVQTAIVQESTLLNEAKALTVETAQVEKKDVEPEIKPEQKSEPAKPDTVMEKYYEGDIEVVIMKQDNKQTKPVKISEKLPAPSAEAIQPVFTATKDDFRQIYYPYTNRPVYENNKTSFLIARDGDTFAKLAKEVKINESNLRAYNDVFDDKYEPVKGEVVYLETKSTKSSVTHHVMKEGESFRFIAQKYALQLKTLLKRNGYAPAAFGIGDKVCVNCK